MIILPQTLRVGFDLSDPSLLLFRSQIPVLVKQILILPDHCGQLFLSLGLCLEEGRLLVPGLLHFPALPDYIAVLLFDFFNSLIFLILDMHNLLRPHNRSIR